jgi:hypothetical protein
MQLKSSVLRPLLGLMVAASVSVGAYAALPAMGAFAETHSNCATFDNNGNVVSVVPNCSQTIHAPSGASSSPSTDPCNGATGTATMNDIHDIFHVNVNGAGDVWITNTDNGTFTFVPDDPTMPSGSGQWSAWFGGSLNNQNTVLTSTFNLTVHLSDGSVVTNHEIMHVTFSASGPNFSFDKPVLSCGG